ncbi:hypothetical protein [Bradyrhizobium tropiciagri]|uniref:hypothetical protein n=1 Tax=Bradyrhizobium tropiciagri TaxID=312253 RepID=UPI00067DEEC4|nr:hypothetical protein [Bradyrhizobium tropiciagri]
MPKNRVRFLKGRCMFALIPPSAIERARLICGWGRPALNLPATEVALRAAIAFLAVIMGMSIGPVSPAESSAIDLSQQNVGAPPEQFEFWRGRQVDVGHWAIVDDSGASGGTAIQRSDPDRTDQAALAIYAPVSMTNARVRTHFKLINGSTPSAGIALRVTGPDDYYLVRVGEDNQRISLLRVARGVSEEIAGVDADIARNHWQTLEVTANDNAFTISLDGAWVLTVFDDSKLVAGQFGIWTERDDLTRFNQVEISSITADYSRFDPQGRPGG